MSGNGNNNNECSEDCCKIPVCLSFVDVCATDDFKDKMKELFSEIFSDLCNAENGNGNNGDDD